jgi:hypothetical protein
MDTRSHSFKKRRCRADASLPRTHRWGQSSLARKRDPTSDAEDAFSASLQRSSAKSVAETCVSLWREGPVEPASRKPRKMTTQEIAERLVALCRQGSFETAQKELYATDAINIEPYGTAAFAKETTGLSAILEKGQKFTAMIEQVHSISVSDPLVAGSSFACAMHLDLTIQGHGRMGLNELCIYEVKDGKIVSEQFTSRFPI